MTPRANRPREPRGLSPGRRRNDCAATFRVDGAHASMAALCQFHVGRNRLAVAADREADRAMIQERLTALAT